MSDSLVFYRERRNAFDSLPLSRFKHSLPDRFLIQDSLEHVQNQAHVRPNAMRDR
jgi:hypothetical protein